MDDKGKTIRVPLNIIQAYNKIQKQKKDAELRGENVPSEYEIARALGIDDEKVEEIIEAGSRMVVSANTKISDEGRIERIDLIATTGPLLEEEVISKLDLELLENAMRIKLTAREFFAVCSRLGIVNEVNNCPSCKSLEEIGAILGVTRERIRQILNQAYRKIKLQYKIQNNIPIAEQKTYTRW